MEYPWNIADDAIKLLEQLAPADDRVTVLRARLWAITDDKTAETCRTKFNNKISFQGEAEFLSGIK